MTCPRDFPENHVPKTRSGPTDDVVEGVYLLRESEARKILGFPIPEPEPENQQTCPACHGTGYWNPPTTNQPRWLEPALTLITVSLTSAFLWLAYRITRSLFGG